MTHIKITKGLDIPIEGKPTGPARPFIPSGWAQPLTAPTELALDLKPFDDVKFKVLVKVNDVVAIGQPLAEDKSFPGRCFCSPAGGVVKEIRRGAKRVLQDIVISVSQNGEDHFDHGKCNIAATSREELISRLNSGGLFAKIRSRPFHLLADPNRAPRHIFVKAVESAPFVPPAELQISGYEKEFQAGLQALSKLTTGQVHLVYRSDTNCSAFTEAQYVTKHTVEGPHPIANASLHIQVIAPIQSADDVLWVLNAHDVVSIGHLLLKGQTFTDRVISIAGPGVLKERTGYFRVREGFPIGALISGRIPDKDLRFISGDPLMGKKVLEEDFLGFYHFAFCVIPEGMEREFLHFFRLGTDKYSFSRAYVSGHRDNTDRSYFFTTNQHGEHRAFVDSTLYDEVQPLPISTMLLVKAVMAEDFELAEQLGLLSVDAEDFALPTFVCPSKMEMTEIMKTGLRQYAVDMG